MNKKLQRMPGISPAERQKTLNASRQSKMARSAHAYVRGSTLKFYEWLEAGAGDRLPQGPPVWICGDCHVGNLGPVANELGKIEIEIRDLDQTVIGNPVHDLVRLGLSLAMAARGSDLPGVTTARMLERLVQGYEAALATPKAGPKVAPVAPIAALMEQAVHRRWRHLAEERIEDVTPTIPLGRRFWALEPEERKALDELFATDDVLAMVRNLHRDETDAKVRVLDAAYWMKGCSSLGRLRYAVLVGVGPKKRQRFGLIDLKEGVLAAAPAAKGTMVDMDFAVRVVTGAKALSPYLGDRMHATTLLRRPMVMRELMPQDMKLEMNNLTQEEAMGAAEYLAGVVGKAHAGQMKASERKSWAAELGRNRSKSLDAPGWLWKAVLELVASHEVAYLEHCRRYAGVAG